MAMLLAYQSAWKDHTDTHLGNLDPAEPNHYGNLPSAVAHPWTLCRVTTGRMRWRRSRDRLVAAVSEGDDDAVRAPVPVAEATPRARHQPIMTPGCSPCRLRPVEGVHPLRYISCVESVVTGQLQGVPKW
jgi:hypothetical protein